MREDGDGELAEKLFKLPHRVPPWRMRMMMFDDWRTIFFFCIRTPAGATTTSNELKAIQVQTSLRIFRCLIAAVAKVHCAKSPSHHTVLPSQNDGTKSTPLWSKWRASKA